jgi:hypothetical protein
LFAGRKSRRREAAHCFLFLWAVNPSAANAGTAALFSFVSRYQHGACGRKGIEVRQKWLAFPFSFFTKKSFFVAKFSYKIRRNLPLTSPIIYVTLSNMHELWITRLRQMGSPC